MEQYHIQVNNVNQFILQEKTIQKEKYSHQVKWKLNRSKRKIKQNHYLKWKSLKNKKKTLPEKKKTDQKKKRGCNKTSS